VEQILSESSFSQNPSRYSIDENEDEKSLLDEAEQSYNRMVDAITSNCIYGMPNDTESPSQIPDVQDGLSLVKNSRKIFDTTEVSQINLVYNDITLQINPDTKFSCEQSSKDELDNASI
jgi:hypothetical protein